MRRKIFYAMVGLFFVVAPAVLLYSQGYVLNFRSGNIVSTGGIFIKTIQPGVRVFLNSDLERETSFLSRGVLLNGLVPESYTVTLEKDGHQPWRKKVSVSTAEVLEFRNVFLPPATATADTILQFGAAPPARIEAFPGNSGAAILEFGDLARPHRLEISDSKSGATVAQTDRVEHWMLDRNTGVLLVARRISSKLAWRSYVLGPGPRVSASEPVVFTGLPAGFSADVVVPHPSEERQFYFFAGGALFLQTRATVPVAIADQIQAFGVTRDHLYFITKTGFFVESDLNGGNTKVLGRKGLYLNPDRPVEIFSSRSGDVFVTDSSGGMFTYRSGTDQELQFVTGSVGGTDLDTAGDRMLLWDDHRLVLYWLRDNPDQPFDIARTKREIYYSPDVIRSAVLDATGSYAFLATDREILMVETDPRGSANVYMLARGRIGPFAFSKDGSALYWVENSALKRLVLR